MIQTIQKTGKSYKAMIALGQCSAFIGTPVLFFNHHGAAAAVALLAGVVLYVIGKAGAWWNHA
jgi:Ni,Fe-hydrogenase I small subunit